MARPLRIEYPDALYHVMSRGNACKNIYLNDNDRIGFLSNLKHCIKLHNVICHAYCLMNNHYHLLLETPDGNLSQVMRDINGNYTQSFNVLHKRVGHLFQGRYRAEIIEKETYLIEVMRYVVLNPVRAKLTANPKDWKWSSYRATVGQVEAPVWLDTDWTLDFFSKNKKEARKHYKEFIFAGIGAGSPFDDIQEGVILGSPQFIHWIWENIDPTEQKKDFPRDQRIVGRPSLSEIFDDFKTLAERDELIYFARNRCGYLTSEIAKHLRLDRSTVGKISRGTYNVNH
jgi:putative transposase